jgi:hypothetical protein
MVSDYQTLSNFRTGTQDNGAQGSYELQDATRRPEKVSSRLGYVSVMPEPATG